MPRVTLNCSRKVTPQHLHHLLRATVARLHNQQDLLRAWAAKHNIISAGCSVCFGRVRDPRASSVAEQTLLGRSSPQTLARTRSTIRARWSSSKRWACSAKSTDCDPPRQELLLGLTGTAHVQCIDLHSAFRIARGPCLHLVTRMSSAGAGRTYRLAPRTLNVMNTLRNVVAMGDVLRVLYHRPSGPRLSDGLRGGQLAAMLRVHIARARGTNTKATHAH